MICKKESKRLRLESQDDEAYVAGKRKPKERGIEIPDFKRKVKPFKEEEEVQKNDIRK